MGYFVYHTEPGANCSIFGDPNSIILDFHILCAQNAAYKKSQKGLKSQKLHYEKFHPKIKNSIFIIIPTNEYCKRTNLGTRLILERGSNVPKLIVPKLKCSKNETFQSS